MSSGPSRTNRKNERIIVTRFAKEWGDPFTIDIVREWLRTENVTDMSEGAVNQLVASMVNEGFPIRRVSRGVYQYHENGSAIKDETFFNNTLPAPVDPPIQLVAERPNILVIRYKGKIWIAEPGK